MCHEDKFVGRWRKIVSVFFHVHLMSEWNWLSGLLRTTLKLNPNSVWDKVSSLLAAVSVKVLLILTRPPLLCTVKYLRLLWFSLLQECTACVTHVNQGSGACPQYLRITTRLHFLKARKDLLKLYVSVQGVKLSVTSLWMFCLFFTCGYQGTLDFYSHVKSTQ